MQSEGSVRAVGGLLKVEIASVRANLLPMAVLWGLAGAAVAAYYLMPGAAGALRAFADWQVEYGKLASFVNRFICGGVLPGVFLLAMPSIRPQRAVATVLAQCVWCGLMGIAVDAQHRDELGDYDSDACLRLFLSDGTSDYGEWIHRRGAGVDVYLHRPDGMNTYYLMRVLNLFKSLTFRTVIMPPLPI